MRVEIGLLGGFTVCVDGVALPAGEWKRRNAAALVKLLALAPRARLHRDRVVDALWPEVDLDAALPRLHKAAHFARQTLRSRDAVVLKDEVVSLFPGDVLDVDVAAFEAAADAALRPGAGSADACTAAAALYRGELLPDDLGEPWSEEPRGRLRSRFVQLLSGAGRWQDVVRLDPADEEAHVELLREAVLAGDRVGALRRYEQMERILDAELGIAPGPEAVALRERVLAPRPAGQRPPAPGDAPHVATAGRSRVGTRETLLERDDELASLLRMARSVVRTGRGGVALVTGEAGSGKSSLTRAFLECLDDDVVVAVGGCDDLLAPRSLGPFRDMAEALPGLASAMSGTVQPDDVFPALLRFLAAAPTVVVVEDVHAELAGQLVPQRRSAQVASGLHVGQQHLGVQRPPHQPGHPVAVEHRPPVLVQQRDRHPVGDDYMDVQVRLVRAGDLVPIARRRHAQPVPAPAAHRAHRGVPLQVAQRGLHPGVQRGQHRGTDAVIAEGPQEAHALRRRAGQVVADHHRRRLPFGHEPGQLSPPHQPPAGDRTPHGTQVVAGRRASDLPVPAAVRVRQVQHEC